MAILSRQLKIKITFAKMIMLTAAAIPNITPMMNMMAAAALAPTESPVNMPRLFRIPLCSRKHSIYLHYTDKNSKLQDIIS